MTSIPEKLSDEALMLFTVDLLVANIPALVSDLGSTKYALLSISEKSRNEVKQKSSLFPAVNTSLCDLFDVRKRVQQKQEELSQLESRLVRMAPTRFVSAEEKNTACANCVNSNTWTQTSGSNIEDPVCSEDLKTQDRDDTNFDNRGARMLDEDDHHSVVVLPPEELKLVREVEALCESEREELVRRSKETNGLEDQFESDRANCEEMTKKVQSLKWKYEKTRRELRSVKLERSFYGLLCSEVTARRALRREGLQILRGLFAASRRAQETILNGLLDEVQADISKVTRELDERRAAQEMDLAVYQIAYKEQQAAAEALGDENVCLRRHATELAVLAREQEADEARRNGMRGVVLASLYMGEGGAVKLTAEQHAEVLAEQDRVSAAAARIGVMEERRRAVAAALMHVTAVEDGAQVLSALKRAQVILKEDITLEEV